MGFELFMTWKHVLGKPGHTYIIGKHWLKKKISKSHRIPKVFSNTICPDYIYYIGFHYLPEDSIKQELWVCMETGELFTRKDVVRWLKESRSKENFENK
ncbi:MAG: hypothetical protein JSW11_17025 [Candidatus Heimdallarchaeota archaeon]|nr:MAG: hypothetical protein JSW11_17025 [Candidatus Heimdallarchaeota archaeon]